MTLRPLNDRVIVKRKATENVSASGLIIAGVTEKSDQGEVIAVGPGLKPERGDVVPLDLEVGDQVIFGKHSGQEVQVDGQAFVVLREVDIFAVIAKR